MGKKGIGGHIGKKSPWETLQEDKKIRVHGEPAKKNDPKEKADADGIRWWAGRTRQSQKVSKRREGTGR